MALETRSWPHKFGESAEPRVLPTAKNLRLLAQGAYKRNQEWRPRKKQTRRGLLSFKSGPLFESTHMSFEQES